MEKKKDKSRLPSTPRNIENESSFSVMSALQDLREHSARPVKSPSPANSTTTPVLSHPAVNPDVQFTTISSPSLSPTTHANSARETPPTTRSPLSAKPVLVSKTALNAAPALSSTPSPSGSPSPAPFNRHTASSTAHPEFGSKPTGSYPFGPKTFAVNAPSTFEYKSQMHTFGQPSVIRAANAMTIARPPVFGRPSGFELATPASNAQRKNIVPSSLSEAPPVVGSLPPTSARSAVSSIGNPPLRVPRQTSQAAVPAASRPATSIFSAPLTAAIPRIVWPNSGTTIVPAVPKMPSTADCAASKLVKELQAQIKPLKQRTLLEGLLSHFTIPDTECIEDNNKCHVCLEPFLTGTCPELPIKLPCKHICGSVCILKWLAPQQAQPREKNCPICRKPIYSVACASEWNALTSLEVDVLGMAGKLQAMVMAPDKAPNQILSLGLAATRSVEPEIPIAWGKGLFLQAGLGHDEMQWRAWTHFLEELVRYVETAQDWNLWYFRRRLVIPIINMVTVLTFIDMKKRGCVWVSRLIEEVPELYLPLHSLSDRAHPDYYLATPGEEQFKKTADLHSRIEVRGRYLWSHTSVYSMTP